MTDEPAMCLAEEWQRDVRGLWAMRGCQYYAGHGKAHAFRSWRYNVEPPSLPAGATSSDQGAPESAQKSSSSSEITRLRSLLQTTEAERDEAQPIDPKADHAWKPTAANINALEDGVRHYIHQLETKDVDPAGDVAALMLGRDTIRQLSAALEDAQLEHQETRGTVAALKQCLDAAESRLSSLTQAHARLRTAAQGVLDRNGGPTDTPYGPFVFVARDDFDAMDAALKAADLAGSGQSAEDSATVQLARLTQAQQRLIAEWQTGAATNDTEALARGEGGHEASYERGKAFARRLCADRLAAVFSEVTRHA